MKLHSLVAKYSTKQMEEIIDSEGIALIINGKKAVIYTRAQVEVWFYNLTTDSEMKAIYEKDIKQTCFKCGKQWDFLLTNDTVVDIKEETTLYYCNDPMCVTVSYFQRQNLFK